MNPNTAKKPEILFEAEDYLIINKPSGIASIPERKPDGKSIKEWLMTKYPEIFVVHRLDKETSGVMVFAKTKESHHWLNTQFEKRKVEKMYLAAVQGRVSGPMESDAAIDEAGKGLMKENKKGKKAFTRFEPLEVFKYYSLLACYPETGRMHQIRVHLKGLGFPIASDLAYGGQAPMLSQMKSKFNIGKYVDEKPILQRFALHASKLSWDDEQGNKLSYEAPLPKDFEAFLQILRKYNSL